MTNLPIECRLVEEVMAVQVIIDRFEEEYAVLELESGEMLNAPRVLFSEFREGAHILLTEKEQDEEDDSATALFEKLRKKSKKKAKNKISSEADPDEK